MLTLRPQVQHLKNILLPCSQTITIYILKITKINIILTIIKKVFFQLLNIKNFNSCIFFYSPIFITWHTFSCEERKCQLF